MSSPAPVPVVCGIIERGGTFLAARRGPRQTNPGRWEFPGGKVCPDETPEDALVRELREELGAEIALEARLRSHVYSYPSITIELIPFVCTMVSGGLHPSEHAEVRWFAPHEADSIAWTPADILVLKAYIDKRKQCARHARQRA
jgi:8-oxo-dGTP diphosphatase